MCQRDCYEGYQLCPAPEAGKWDDNMIKVLVSGWSPNGEEEGEEEGEQLRTE